MSQLSPGVYVLEQSTGARPIQSVGTSTAAFVGVAPKKTAHVDEAIGVANWTAFQATFGDKDRSTDLSDAVRGFFLNGGSYCYVLNIADPKKLVKTLEPDGELDRIDEIAIVAAPGMATLADWNALIGHCERLGDRVAILDPPGKVKKLTELTSVATAPDKPGGPPQSSYAAFYYPRLIVSDGRNQRTVAPSGFMAGAWARTDAARGVHKAPANIGLGGVIGLEHSLSRSEQGLLNPKGINVIRAFADRGILVWGARTTDDAASEYRYLPVRRLMNQIKESIEEGTRWVVFEPNDETLWASIRRDVSAYLRSQWRAGALQGASESEAFFVQCDAETNTPDDIAAGRVVVRIGVAPVKPAEFVIFQIGQMSEVA